MSIRSKIARSTAIQKAADSSRPLYRKFFPYTGLNGLDRKLIKHVGTEPGTFIEAGANDGLKQSNTYYLESRCDWTGLLVATAHWGSPHFRPVPLADWACANDPLGSGVSSPPRPTGVR